MDYVIKNGNRLYIKLSAKGSPQTCREKERGLFDYQKAKNILDSLPKPLKKMNFYVEAIPDISSQTVEVVKKVLQNEGYEVSDNITRWVEEFGKCDDVIEKAKAREKELLSSLKVFDQEMLDILHMVEIEKPKNLYDGWRCYKTIKENRKNRREVKDELLIIENILNRVTNVSLFHRETVQKAIDGLFSRKYTYRIVEDGEE